MALKFCRSCGSGALHEAFSLGEIQMAGYFPSSIDENVPSSNLSVLLCADCGLGQLRENPELAEMYGENYGYRSGLNDTMVRHLDSTAKLLQTCQLDRSGRIGTVLDIGANDGTLLSFFDQAGELIGIDPTSDKFQAFYPPGAIRSSTFFSADAYRAVTDREADIVTSIAMLYDVEDPIGFAREIHEILSPEGVWHLELSYTPWVLREAAFDTVCHEHLLYMNYTNLHFVLREAGFKPIRIVTNTVNGGSIALTAAKSSSRTPEDYEVSRALLDIEKQEGSGTMEVWQEFGRNVRVRQQAVRSLLENLKAAGKSVSALGASTKGNVLLQSSGIDSTLIDVVGDVNPDKFGKFLPGSKVPIVPENQVIESAPDFLLLLPWHFRSSLVDKHRDYLLNGGRMIVPLPQLEILGA